MRPSTYRIKMFRGSDPEAAKLMAQSHSIRQAVFIDEQQVAPEEEWDALDAESTHWLAYDERETPIATCRMRASQQGCQTPPVAKLERIAVLKPHRGQSVGKLLLLAMLEEARTAGFTAAYLHGQTHARAFYEKLAFVAEGFPFDEAGIEHTAMRRVL